MIFPSTLEFEDKKRLVQALLACACMETEQARNLLIGNLNAEIRNNVKAMPTNQMHVHGLVETCLSYAGGINQLFERVAAFEGGSIPWHALNELRYQLCARAKDKRLTWQLLDELQPLFQAAPNVEIVRQCFWQSCPDPSLPPEPSPNSASEAFLRLFEFAALNALCFLDRLAACYQVPAQAQALRQWTRKLAHAWQLSAALDQQQAELVARANQPVYLLVQFWPTTPDAEAFTIQAWAWKDQDDCQRLDTGEPPCHFAAAEERVRKFVSDVQIQFETKNIVVELIVPRKIFCENLNEWKVNVGEMSRPLVREYPVVLRWWKRFRARQEHLDWREKWAFMRDAHAVNQTLELDWLACADVCTPDDLLQNFTDPQCGAWVALGFVPAHPSELLFASLNAGTPVAVWFRQLDEAAALSKQSMLDLLENAAPLDLPQRLRDWRRQHRQDRQHPIHQLMLLFDAYDRVPPTLKTQAPVRG